jgi:hypothetical protein
MGGSDLLAVINEARSLQALDDRIELVKHNFFAPQVLAGM